MSKRPYNHIKAQKEGKDRDSFMCFFCQRIFKRSHGHHIMPYSEDGPGTANNIITLCPECHTGYHPGRIQIDIGTF